jgi:hypothetical protein
MAIQKTKKKIKCNTRISANTWHATCGHAKWTGMAIARSEKEAFHGEGWGRARVIEADLPLPASDARPRTLPPGPAASRPHPAGRGGGGSCYGDGTASGSKKSGGDLLKNRDLPKSVTWLKALRDDRFRYTNHRGGWAGVDSIFTWPILPRLSISSSFLAD